MIDFKQLSRDWWRKRHQEFQYSVKREQILPANDFQMEEDLAAFAASLPQQPSLELLVKAGNALAEWMDKASSPEDTSDVKKEVALYMWNDVTKNARFAAGQEFYRYPSCGGYGTCVIWGCSRAYGPTDKECPGCGATIKEIPE